VAAIDALVTMAITAAVTRQDF